MTQSTEKLGEKGQTLMEKAIGEYLLEVETLDAKERADSAPPAQEQSGSAPLHQQAMGVPFVEKETLGAKDVAVPVDAPESMLQQSAVAQGWEKMEIHRFKETEDQACCDLWTHKDRQGISFAESFLFQAAPGTSIDVDMTPKKAKRVIGNSTMNSTMKEVYDAKVYVFDKHGGALWEPGF